MTVGLTANDPHTNENGLWVIGRREFARDYFDYQDGDHVLFGGPTRRGKSSLAFCLLGYVASPELPAYVAVSKPTDPVSQKEGSRLGFRRVHDWPVSPHISQLWNGKPRGYLVWPRFGDMENDVDNCGTITRRLLEERYSAGAKGEHAILVMDDTVTKSRLMKLDKPMLTHLAMSGAMGVGIWVFVQKPTGSGEAALWSYGAAEHVFLTRDPDRKNQLRYDEIGGFDPRAVTRAVNSLQPYEFLYLKRTERYMCIIGAK